MSFKAQMLYRSLNGVGKFAKKIFNNILTNPPRNTNKISEKKLNSSLTTNTQYVDGFKIITITNEASTNNHMLFFHGGGYTVEALDGHREFVEQLVLIYHFKVTYIDYPLAPEHTASTTIKMVENAYNQIITQYNMDTFFLVGDSAGGGLALALLQCLRDNQCAIMPTKTALLSPWLDITLSNPCIPDFESKEVILEVDILRKCGIQYAGNMELTDPRVSPIYGDLSGLGEVNIWVSDHEIMYPDSILLQEKLNNSDGSSSTICVKEKLVHDWIVMPIRERDETIREISTLMVK